ncbi:hypothetical protein CF319_g9197 [Tilletia indica]|nr:hypothetical protein CF319_g9197 [Tilletia indica]
MRTSASARSTRHNNGGSTKEEGTSASSLLSGLTGVPGTSSVLGKRTSPAPDDDARPSAKKAANQQQSLIAGVTNHSTGQRDTGRPGRIKMRRHW